MDILDFLAILIIKNISKFDFRGIASIMINCENLNYQNYELFDCVEIALLKRLKVFVEEDQEKTKEEEDFKNKITTENIKIFKSSSVFSEKNDSFQEPQTINNPLKNPKMIADEITLVDSSMILKAFCKLKVIKPKLFETLQALFIKDAYKASASVIISMAYSHSMLCSEMLFNYEDNKKEYYKRSLIRIKSLFFKKKIQ